MVAVLVAAILALSVAGHGFDERAGGHSAHATEAALIDAAHDVKNSVADALSAHLHGEHHQLAPCHAPATSVARREGRVVYAALDTHGAGRVTAPPHGPPKA